MSSSTTTSRTTSLRTTSGRRRTRAGIVAGATALVLLTAGCSGGTRVGGDAPEAASGDDAGLGDVTGEIRLAYWGSGSRVDLTNGVSDLFVAENEGVSVTPEFTDFAAYFQRLNVQASSGGMACITQLQGRQLNDYAGQGLLLDLQPLVDSGAIDVSGIPEDVLDTGRGTDGALYEIPYGAAYDAIMVNTTLAEEAGVGSPADGWTWQEFFDYARAAQGSLPEGVSGVNLLGGHPNTFIEWLRGRGQEVFEGTEAAFSADDVVEYWSIWEGLRGDGVTISAPDRAAEAAQVEQSWIAQGRVMSDNKPGNQIGQAQGAIEGAQPGQELTTVQLPRGEDGSSSTVLFTSGWSIPRSCDNVPTAAAYIDFWINDPEANALFASNNGAVTNTEMLQAQLDDESLDPATRQTLELYQEIVEDEPPTVLYPAGYQANFETAFQRAYEDVALNGADPQATAESFVENLDAALASA
ncbi:extracellular solute-binding protein [uncultured Pseudokineococcus sp.]|uniref:ABC transporter substrate-binding protein n=1 Tax=uncultured Pseudokineococcus sp. TaxID=1642928 RepID=UPI002617444B|nr:extracellular solute-binding protein [uncultured Pseudokineococcus sp.]